MNKTVSELQQYFRQLRLAETAGATAAPSCCRTSFMDLPGIFRAAYSFRNPKARGKKSRKTNEMGAFSLSKDPKGI